MAIFNSYVSLTRGYVIPLILIVTTWSRQFHWVHGFVEAIPLRSPRPDGFLGREGEPQWAGRSMVLWGSQFWDNLIYYIILYHGDSYYYIILLYHIIISYYIIIHVLLTWQCENEWIQSKHKRGKSWVGPGPLTLVPETEFHTFSHACSLVATSELHPIGPIGSWAPRNNHDPPVWLRSRQRLNGSWAHFWPRNW